MLRSALFNLVFWPVFVLYLLVVYPFVFFMSEDATLKFAYRPLSKWLLFCLDKLANIKCSIKNRHIVPDTTVIIGCNHQSTWETFVFSVLFDNLTIVIKKELLQKPVAGIYFKRLGCIPIDRSSPIKAIKTLLKFGKIAYENGKSILIFPNGSRESADKQTEYKSGIFAMYKSFGIPVVPAHVNSGSCWPRRSFKKIPGTITLDFREPIRPGLDKEEFFRVFEERMA